MLSSQKAIQFCADLRNLYFSETKVKQSLPVMAANAHSSAVRAMFENLGKETGVQIDRLEKIFGLIGQKAEGNECSAVKRIIREVGGLIGEVDDGNALDSALLAAVQAIESYEIARYSSLCGMARELGWAEAQSLLERNLSQERNADCVLTELAELSFEAYVASQNETGDPRMWRH